jgi:hypothetical protein
VARRKASEIFAGVDPHLKVIDATRYRRRGKKAKKLTEVAGPAPEPYRPLPVTEEQWEEAQGITCPICGEETYQLFPYGFGGKRKACKKCIERRTKLLEYRARIVEYKGRLATARASQRYERGML